jgi:tRNA-guanine family transglycosylase
LRHLFQAGEMLGGILTSLHNLSHFQALVLDIRKAMAHNDWSSLARAWPVVAAADLALS